MKEEEKKKSYFDFRIDDQNDALPLKFMAGQQLGAASLGTKRLPAEHRPPTLKCCPRTQARCHPPKVQTRYLHRRPGSCTSKGKSNPRLPSLYINSFPSNFGWFLFTDTNYYTAQ